MIFSALPFSCSVFSYLVTLLGYLGEKSLLSKRQGPGYPGGLLALGVTLTGLPTGQIGYSRTGLLIQRVHQNAPLLHISGLSPVDMLIHFRSINNTLYFLHIEHSNSHNYTDFIYTSVGLYKDININTIHRLIHTRPLPSRTQHRLARSCHFSRAPPINPGITPSNARDVYDISRPFPNTVY